MIQAFVAVPDDMLSADAHRQTSPEVEAWRRLMTSDEGLDACNARSPLVENANANLKDRYGLTGFRASCC